MSEMEYAEFDDPKPEDPEDRKNKKKPVDLYSDEYIRAHRTFPKKNVFILTLLFLIQLALIAVMIFARPGAQDRIDYYGVTVSPRADGKLDVTYSLIWTPLDTSEPLTWITVGVPNHDCQIVSKTGAAKTVSYDFSGDYTAVRIDLDRAYSAGDIVELSFSTVQGSMLCRRGGEYFYEFVPGWFNAVPVSHYVFRWADLASVTNHNGTPSGTDLIWEGDFAPGGYQAMRVSYAEDKFPSDVTTSPYRAFDGDGTEDELASDRAAMIVFLTVGVIVLLVIEVIVIDSFVSYSRGRGFLVGYGHPIHVYGRANPAYEAEAAKHSGSSHGGSGHGGGCACACACACAGGGRAGCSQKNTTDFGKREKTDNM